MLAKKPDVVLSYLVWWHLRVQCMATLVFACRNLEERNTMDPEEDLWSPDLGRDRSEWKGMTKDFSSGASNNHGFS